MNRFRKRSDAKRQHVPQHLASSSITSHYSIDSESQDSGFDLPKDLPPVSDFRTSLILPDLSRRFSLLRSTVTGQPLSLDNLRTRLAEQRARGDSNHVLEEEEDMILETLARMKNKTMTSGKSSFDSDSFAVTASTTNGSVASEQSSPAKSPSKRYSNNLFGSSRHKETGYIRSVARAQARKTSTTPSEVSLSSSTTSPSRPGSSRPTTPDHYSSTDATVPPNLSLGFRSAPLSVPAPYGRDEPQQPGTTNNKRVSRALENVLHELEEEDEQIVMPRSAPFSPNTLDYVLPPIEKPAPEPYAVAGMAISPDVDEFDWERRTASPILSRTVPGYVPGMARPTTPHMDNDSRPGTPRGATPPPFDSPHTSFVSSTPVPAEGTISPAFRRSASPSPMFLNRSPSSGGHRTPDNTLNRMSTASPSLESRMTRRPASPISANTYQPMAVSDHTGPPSHMSWGNQAHSRSGSWVSDAAEVTTTHGEPPFAPSRSLKSPPLPDSPTDREQGTFYFASEDNSDQNGGMLYDHSIESQTTPTGTPAPAPQTTPTQTTLLGPSIYRSGSADPHYNPYQSASSSGVALNPFVFSPIPNSSRSSLESAGSSYHSESGDGTDPVASLFERTDSSQTSWHDLSVLDHSPAHASSLTGKQADEIIGRYGLKSSDFFAIQTKLVSAAIAKLSAPESTERVGSLRRRRRSTSHNSITVKDFQRVNSPPPRTLSPPVGHAENLSRATALLNSMVANSPPPSGSLTHLDVPPPAKNRRDVSPSTQRNRDLAQMIFGGEEESQQPAPVQTGWSGEISPSYQPRTTPTSANHPFTPQSPSRGGEHSELERQVMYKNNAAMLALRKRPSNSNMGDGLVSSPSFRKKITPHQISTPTLVSASASVDTIPLPMQSPPTSAQSKFGSTLKRLRGTLRAKPSPVTAAEDVSLRSPPAASQFVIYDPSRLHVGGDQPAQSATEPGRFKVPIASPPASAGPGLKGFMSRFRGNKRAADMGGDMYNDGPYGYDQSYPSTPRTPQGFGTTPTTPGFPNAASTSSPNLNGFSTPIHDRMHGKDDNEAGKIQRLFDVASDLGVDQSALNDLLVRSASTSTQATRWSRATGADPRGSMLTSNPRPGIPPFEEPSTPTPPPPATSDSTSLHKPRARPRPGRDAKNGDGGNSVVLRRTLIFPSDTRVSTAEPTPVKRSSSQRKRTSLQSHPGRSVHDRAPTPPPGRTSQDQRSGSFPPVPQLPSSLAGAGSVIQSTNSPYDSLYDPSSTDSQPAADGSSRPKGLEEPGSALEVIELANGETIWQIVNGLRGEDSESIYPRGNSFASEYSHDDVQIFFKEHARSNSKGSNASASDKKPDYDRPDTKIFYSSPDHIGRLMENLSSGMDAGSFNIMAGYQPEPALPSRRLEHSTTSSMSSGVDWSMEDRLEHMLGSLNSNRR